MLVNQAQQKRLWQVPKLVEKKMFPYLIQHIVTLQSLPDSKKMAKSNEWQAIRWS